MKLKVQAYIRINPVLDINTAKEMVLVQIETLYGKI